MNLVHLVACRSRLWRRHLDLHVLPRVLHGVELVGEVLELGPGPGLVTRRLVEAHRAGHARLTVLEVDPVLAANLEATYATAGVRVVNESAARMPFPDASFDVVVACTMLHHVTPESEQDALLREALRVLGPGGTFVGSDSLPSWPLRLAHLGDTYAPVDLAAFPARLRSAGAVAVDVEERSSFFVFRCRSPLTDDS